MSPDTSASKPRKDGRIPRGIPRYAIVLVLVLVAALTRLLPVAISPLPYNNDGMTECRISDDILFSGHLEYPEDASYFGTHSVMLPIFSVLMAFAGSVLGTSSFDIAQMVVAVLAVLTVVGSYLLGLQICRSIRGALATAMVLALFGTFVFATGSTWKVSLGMAMLALLMYSYVNRGSRRFLIIELLILLILPFVHHLASMVAYLTLLYLAVWSMFFAASRGMMRRRPVIDFLIVLFFFTMAYVYYKTGSLDRLTLVDTPRGLVALGVAFIGMSVVMIVVLSQEKHAKLSFAPAVGAGLFLVFAIDYGNESFSYIGSSLAYVLILAGSTAAIVAVAWFGLEAIIESSSRYRAIPLCLLLPFLMLSVFSLLSGFSFNSQQILYRSFDFADIGAALGVGYAITVLNSKPKLMTLVGIIVVLALLVTFPFSYATGELIGVRHDTQEYEVDAFEWLRESASPSSMLQSDERLSYIAMALYDFEKQPYLPSRLVDGGLLGIGAFYVLEDEWMTVGVNNFPNGHPVIDQAVVQSTLASSNVNYVGGPASDRIIVFQPSLIGQRMVFGSDS